MIVRTMTAEPGKVFAYKDENNKEIVLGSILFLGINDDGLRYYQIDDPETKESIIESIDYTIE